MSKESPFSRREFLIRTGRVAGLATVAGTVGFSLHEKERFPFASQDEKPVTRDLRVSGIDPKIVVARGTDPAAMTRAALQAMGGLALFIQKGDRVVVKPNIGWDRVPEQAANTNPVVVSTIVRECLAAGAAEVIVTDVTCNETSRCFARSGIARAAEEAGARVEQPTDIRFRKVNMGGSVLGTRPVYDAYLEADKMINVPIAKHHSLTGVTLGLKNLYGIISGRRNQLHQNIHASIADLGNFLRPTLTVMDAVRVLRRNGPQGGNLADVEETGMIMASNDVVALDAYTGETIFGMNSDSMKYLALAERYGYGKADYSLLPMEEISV